MARLAGVLLAFVRLALGEPSGTPPQPREVVKGISYGPMPCKEPCWVSQDDFFSQSAKPMWGARGRGDLEVIRQLGANAVRLYGNNPENTHRDFLDEAEELGLRVIPGLSDYDFIQSPENCLTTDFNCYAQVKKSYRELLQKGFLREGRYHPALRELIVINEPDLKLPGMHAPVSFCRGILSAVDAMLDAEKSMNLTGPGINFTVAFSFGVCSTCGNYTSSPALGQMTMLRAAFRNASLVGYVPKNNLTKFYDERFHNSFNTANPAFHLQEMFLSKYEKEFPHTPVMIQEYHNPHGDVEKDLRDVLQMAQGSKLLNGVNFFEFHVRYDKGGSEMDFGMFQLGDFAVQDFDYFGDSFKAWCLVPAKSKAGEVLPTALMAAYGGKELDFAELCLPDPRKVTLTAQGYRSIAEQRRPEKMQIFVERLVTHMGGKVSDAAALRTFAQSFDRRSIATVNASSPGPGQLRPFSALVAELRRHPSWAGWSESTASCIADRRSHEPAVGSAVGDACRHLEIIQCHEVPSECKSNIWGVADYVFGVYYAQHGGKSPLEHCYFNGSARLGDGEALAETKSACVVPPTWRPKRRLQSDHGDMGFEAQPLELLEEEEEAAWLLVPALLAGVAATGTMGALMSWCRSAEPPEPLASPISEKPITIQVIPVASHQSLSSMVSVSSTDLLAQTE
ncbi:Hypothetical protein (Fragment) [Durusdinium trenchii]